MTKKASTFSVFPCMLLQHKIIFFFCLFHTVSKTGATHVTVFQLLLYKIPELPLHSLLFDNLSIEGT